MQLMMRFIISTGMQLKSGRHLQQACLCACVCVFLPKAIHKETQQAGYITHLSRSVCMCVAGGVCQNAAEMSPDQKKVPSPPDRVTKQSSKEKWRLSPDSPALISHI